MLQALQHKIAVKGFLINLQNLLVYYFIKSIPLLECKTLLLPRTRRETKIYLFSHIDEEEKPCSDKAADERIHGMVTN